MLLLSYNRYSGLIADIGALRERAKSVNIVLQAGIEV
jgi:hypothetical protein